MSALPPNDGYHLGKISVHTAQMLIEKYLGFLFKDVFMIVSRNWLSMSYIVVVKISKSMFLSLFRAKIKRASQFDLPCKIRFFHFQILVFEIQMSKKWSFNFNGFYIGRLCLKGQIWPDRNYFSWQMGVHGKFKVIKTIICKKSDIFLIPIV